MNLKDIQSCLCFTSMTKARGVIKTVAKLEMMMREAG